ncbi:MAG: ABC transporter ATP-binding protein, partial [Rhodospirillaceae bacterium]|nr:ABC transporter ATP-binding protein [Rhodospirillaceae bacterium]
MATIRLDRLRKAFAGHVAVDGLDLEVRDGEFLVLLGPSGCGKTTTLNCIAGLEQPSAGRILFDDRDVTAEPPHLRNVAMVFQSAMLYPHMTARQNIEASLRRSGLPAEEKRRRIEQAVAILEIGDLMDKLPSQMSGGQRQRVATAKAIVRQPTAFLLDEPLSALDAALRLTLRAELVNLQKRLATTTVFVTHDQVEAMTMGDRIAVMRDGRLEQIGTPDDIYNRPQTVFVAGFVGSPPMNFIEGAVAEGCFRSGPLALRLAAPPGPAILGVRPQDLAVVGPGTDGALPAAVFALEHLGRESVVIAEAEKGLRLRALVSPGFSARLGEPLWFAPDPTRCLLFAPDGRPLDGARAGGAP